MQCKQVHNHLSAYLDRELTAELASAVRHHLAGCPECRAMLEELRGTADLLGRLPVRAAPAGLADDVRREIERRMLTPQAADDAAMPERTLAAHRVRLWPRALAVAACLALAAGIGLVAYFGGGALDEPPAAGPGRVAHHDALEEANGRVAFRGGEEVTTGLRSHRAAGTGEVTGEPLAFGDDLRVLDETGDVAAVEGLDLDLRLKDAPTTASLNDMIVAAGDLSVDAYSFTDSLGRKASASDLASLAGADKSDYVWCMKEADEPRLRYGYFDVDGSRRLAGASVNVVTQNGDRGVAFDALDPGETHLAFGRPAQDAGAAPAEVLLGESMRGAQVAGADRSDVAGVEERLFEKKRGEALSTLGVDVARVAPEAAPSIPAPAEPPTDAAAEVPEDATDFADVEPDETAGTRVARTAPKEEAKAAGYRTAKAAPTGAPEPRPSRMGKAAEAARARPADPQVVQMTMNTVAVGDAPLGSLREVANDDNLRRASNQLVVRSPSRETANEDLVRLFARNGWRKLDESAKRNRGRRETPAKAPAPIKGPAPTGGGWGVPGGGAGGKVPEGLYYLASRNGEDLWVVLTTPDDLSRFATQVAQSRTLEVAEESSHPFQAVRYLQRQLARFEAEARRRNGTVDARMGGERAGAYGRGQTRIAAKGGAGAAPEAEETEREPARGIAGGTQVGTGQAVNGPQVETPPEAGQALAEAGRQAKKAEEDLFKKEPDAAQRPEPGPEAPGLVPQKDEEGEAGARRLARQEAAEEPEAEKPAARPAATAAKAAQGESSEAAAEQQALAQTQPAAVQQQRFSLHRIPPNQVMLIVRVRSADGPPRAAEALQQEAETAEPAKTQEQATPAAKE